MGKAGPWWRGPGEMCWSLGGGWVQELSRR